MSAKLLLRLALAAVFAMLLSSVACQKTTSPNNQPAMNISDSKDWDSYVNDFLEAYFLARPDFAVRQGRHEFDGKLPDWSAEGFAKEVKRLHAQKDRLAAFQDSTLRSMLTCFGRSQPNGRFVAHSFMLTGSIRTYTSRGNMRPWISDSKLTPPMLKQCLQRSSRFAKICARLCRRPSLVLATRPTVA